MYDYERVQKIWQSIENPEHRKWAMSKGEGDAAGDVQFKHFNSIHTEQELLNAINSNNWENIHVGACVSTNDRDWIIDIDPNKSMFIYSNIENSILLNLYNTIAAYAFKEFFGINCKVFHSGNRGVHVWLNPKIYKLDASSALRSNILKHFSLRFINMEYKNTFYTKYLTVLNFYEDEIKKFCKRNKIPIDKSWMIHTFFPNIDQNVFKNANHIIRCQFSFNSKGGFYSAEIIFE